MVMFVQIMKNKYLPFVLAVPFFFCMSRYDGIIFDAILYVTQYVFSIDPNRFLGDPAFLFGNQNSLGLFSPIFGPFLELFGVSLGAFIYTFLMQLSWIFAAICICKCLMRFVGQRLWILPVTILSIVFFAHGMAFSRIQFFNYISPYACSRSLSIALGMGALALIFSKKRFASLLLILAGIVVHPLTAGWCLPFWLFYFFPKTKIPIVVVSLLIPLSGWLHLGVLDFLPMDWLERPLEFQPDYVFFSRTLVLLSFFGIAAKWSANERIREISFSLFILVLIASYWNIWGGIGEHIFLYQVQPWRAVWVPSIIAVPLGVCFVKDVFRRSIKRKCFTTHDFGIIILVVSFLAPANPMICSVVAVTLFLKREMNISLKVFALIFIAFLGMGYFLQQYYTWCLQGFYPFFGIDFLKLGRFRDTFLLYQMFFVIAFVVFFFRTRYFLLAAIMLASIFISRFMLLPLLPLFMYFYSKERGLKYWGLIVVIACLIIIDGLFDTESRRMTLIDGMPLKFPKISFALLFFFISLSLPKRISIFCFCLWFVVCCIVSFENYKGYCARKFEKEVVLDQYLHKPIFSQIKDRGKILFYVTGDYDLEPRLQFYSGSYLSQSSMIGGLFNHNHYRMALERSHLLYKKAVDPESAEYYFYNDIIKKFTDADTLIDRSTFLCEKNEISHLVTDKLSLPFTKEDSAMVNEAQKVFLYACPSKTKVVDE